MAQMLDEGDVMSGADVAGR